MKRWTVLVACLAWVLFPCPAPACSYCGGSMQSQTLRQDATQARLVLYGTLANPRLNQASEVLGGGTTDLLIEQVIKSDAFLGNKKVVEIPRYVPVSDPKNPPKFLIFCDVFKNKGNVEKLDPYRGLPVKSTAIVDYLKGALSIDPKDRVASLRYDFDFLDHRDPDISNDAFLEFAKASDQEIGAVAAKLSPGKLRTWLRDPQTPVNRLSLYGFLLGACGSTEDATQLETMLRNPTEQTISAIDGLLGGYLELRPREGWALIDEMLRDGKKPFIQRFAVLRTLRFLHGWKPQDTRSEVVRGLGTLVEQGDIADLAIEDLRRWEVWDLTGTVLAQYGQKSHDVPIVRRSIVRYALSCPRDEAKQFLNTTRLRNPDLIKEVEESLEFEKKK